MRADHFTLAAATIFSCLLPTCAGAGPAGGPPLPPPSPIRHSDFGFRISATPLPLFAPSSPHPQVIIIGLDAAEWEIINPLLQEGKLPHLKRLIEGGVAAPLESIEPMISPSLWTTIATGKNRREHGITGFVVRDKQGQAVPVTSNFRAVKSLWNIVSDRGLRAGFINWWPSYPAEPVNGFIVSNYMRYFYPQLFAQGENFESENGPLQGVVYPKRLETLGRAAPPETPGFFQRVDREKIARHRLRPVADPTFRVTLKNAFRVFTHAITEDELVKNVAVRLLAREPVDLFGVYFEGIDVLSHLFWHYYRPAEFGVTPEEARDLGGVLPAYYEHSDSLVGELLAGCGSETTVIVVSDHGYGSTGQGRHGHRRYGVIILSGPPCRKGARLPQASVLDVAPTVLYLLGLPVARDMPGRVLLDALSDEFKAAHPLTWVATYETPGAVKEPQEAIVTPLDKETREKLRTLGYIK